MTHTRGNQGNSDQCRNSSCRCQHGSGSWNPQHRQGPPHGSNYAYHRHQLGPESGRFHPHPEPEHCPGCGTHFTGAILPNVITKMTDVRYRSFHNFNQFHSNQPSHHFAGKSRASWAVPVPVPSHGRPLGPVFSSGFLAYPSEADLSSHPDLAGPYFRRVAPATSCGCLNSLPYHPPPAMLDPGGHYYPHSGHQCLAYATSSYDLTTSEQSGPRWHQQHSTRMSNRKNQSSQTPEEEDKSKSLRWTKEQLKKFDNLIVKPPKQTPPHRNGSLSSSSGGAFTDDSGIHSRSTTNSSSINNNNNNNDKAKSGDLTGRASAGRRPIRKLPAPPKRTSQAHVVKLNTGHDETRKQRSLPTWPHVKPEVSKDVNNQKDVVTVSGRLSNFFRSVKLSKGKKESVKSIKTFGTDLMELYNTTNERVPSALAACTDFIEKEAMVDGVYRISGIASNIKRLRSSFESGITSNFLSTEDWIRQDIHCVPSLVKLFFRELPEPLCSRETLPLLKKAAAVGSINSDSRESLPYFKAALGLMRKPHYWTLKHLLLHLQRVSERVSETGMSSKNLAIVWTPNLLRTPLFLSHPTLNTSVEESVTVNNPQKFSPKPDSKMEHPRLQFNLVQNTQIVQYLIENAATIFQTDPHSIGSDLYAQNFEPFQSLNCDKTTSVQRQTPLSKRYVTSFPVAANDFEPTSLPMSKSVGNIAEPNIVRLNTRQEKEEKSQVCFENKRRSTIVNVVGHPSLPNDVHCMSSCHHNHPREVQVPPDQNILRQTHHPSTHRHIHVQPVYMMKTISQV